ncbi:uncharacterized protein TNCV_2515811 [Trichonephila clavipes]|nr:uncharacterized protein TNCV_2515811 [Trichonephila clavipes]
MDRIFICETLTKRNEIDPFLKRMVTDKKWVTDDNIVRKRSWSKRSEAAQTVAKPGLTARKCNNRIVIAQRKRLNDFLRVTIIGRLECGRTQLEVSEELGIAQSVISRLWQRFQDDVWRAPGTRYHQENTIERYRYGSAGWLVWGGIILGSRTDLHVQSVTMTGHIYRDVILE